MSTPAPLSAPGRYTARPVAYAARPVAPWRLARLARNERGTAVVEFAVLAVVLLVPLVYLVMTLARLEAAAYAVSAAAREAGRAFVTAPDAATGRTRAQAAADLAFADQGFDGGTVRVRCAASACLTPEAEVEVVTRVVVPLPLVPAVARDIVPLELPVTSRYVAVVDRFRAPR